MKAYALLWPHKLSPINPMCLVLAGGTLQHFQSCWEVQRKLIHSWHGKHRRIYTVSLFLFGHYFYPYLILEMFLINSQTVQDYTRFLVFVLFCMTKKHPWPINSTWQQLVWNYVFSSMPCVVIRSSTPTDLNCKNQGNTCSSFFRTRANDKQM